MLPAMLAGQKEPSTGGLVVFDFPKFLKGNTAQNGLHDLRQFLTKSDLDNLLMKENWSYKGAYYGIPNANTVSMYWYNKKILDDAKIDPTTFKLYGDFIDAGLKLKRDKGIYMTFLDVASWNHFLTLARQNGGGTFDKDGNPIIDSPANLEALQLWYDMLKKHGIAMPTTSFFGAGTYEAYKRREVAGMIMADWWLKFSLAPSVPEQSGEWYGAALPRFKAGGLRTAHRGGTAFVVQKNVERPDILVEFLKYLYMTTDGWVEKMRAAAQVPSWVPAFDTPEIKNYKEPFLGGQQPMSLYSELSKEVPPDYTGPFETEALTLISQKVIPAVFGGEKSPAQALRDAQTSIKQTIAAG
jgi:ABC-type glycerol-3-phosphate transport system substrate-binding protein